jgi:hypothetical protein
MHFASIARSGKVVDSGVVRRQGRGTSQGPDGAAGDAAVAAGQMNGR